MAFQQIKSYASVRNIFLAVAGIQLLIMLVLSFGAGISADEYRHYKQAAKVYKYYQTKGEDKSALENTGIDPMQFNGQAFDNVMYTIEKWFHIENYMELRHFFNALSGWLIILLAGLIMKELLGYRAAIFVLLALFLTPRFFGHALNNNKDIPFALGFILTIYGNIVLLKQMPKPKWSAYTLLTLGIALSISIRLAGILNIFFVAFSLGLYYLTHKPIKELAKPENLKILYKLAGIVLGVAVAGYILGILYWPFMLEGPITNISEIFKAISSHPVSLNQLFQGELIKSNQLPWYYTILYITITYPLYILIGLMFSIVLLKRLSEYVNITQVLTIVFPWLFVVFWMSYKNSNVYGVVRHITFIYPLAVITSVMLFYTVVKIARTKTNGTVLYVIILLVAASSWHSIFHVLKNTRYSYVYYNELVGGVKGAYGKFETDYFYHSIREASLWVYNKAQAEVKTGKKIVVATNHSDPASYYFRNDTNFVVKYVRYYQRGEHDWDYAIFVNSYIVPYQLQNNIYPPVNTIHTIDVNKRPVCAILKRHNRNDLTAFRKMKSGDFYGAIPFFERTIKEDPQYEWALLKLMECYFNTNNYNKVIKTGEACLKAYGNNERAYLFIGLSYLRANQADHGIMIFNRMIKNKLDEATAYFYKGVAYTMKNDPTKALTSLLKSTEINPNNPQAYKIIGDIYKQQKNTTMANKYYQIFNSLVSNSK